MVPFAKPAYAFAGESRPVSTAADTANTDAVRIGNALMTTDAIAAAKTTKSLHASGVNPSGGETNQADAATATSAARSHLVRAGPVVIAAPLGGGCGRADRPTVPESHPPRRQERTARSGRIRPWREPSDRCRRLSSR